MNSGVDRGPLLSCDRFPICPSDTPMTLLELGIATGLAMIKRDLHAIAGGSLEGIAQGDGRTFTRERHGLHRKPESRLAVPYTAPVADELARHIGSSKHCAAIG